MKTITAAPYACSWLGRTDKDIRQLRNVIGNTFGWEEADEKKYMEHYELKGKWCVVGRVAGYTVAYVLFTQFAGGFEVTQIAVLPKWRRKGYGKLLIENIKGKMSDYSPLLMSVVPERDTTACLFMRSCGFRATGVVRQEFGDEDGYSFEYRRAT